MRKGLSRRAGRTRQRRARRAAGADGSGEDDARQGANGSGGDDTGQRWTASVRVGGSPYARRVRLTDPIALQNTHVRLEPLSPSHEGDLARAQEGLEYAWYTSVPASVGAEIAHRLDEHDAGRMNPWAVVDAATGRAVGMTTFCNIDQEQPRVEIGYTWLSPSAQRTATNTAAKLLLLGHAFDACGVIAVEFRTSWHNRPSRAAIERLGAKQDGILRNHRRGPGGSMRDTVVYSILPHEWPGVRLGLQSRLNGHDA